MSIEKNRKNTQTYPPKHSPDDFMGNFLPDFQKNKVNLMLYQLISEYIEKKKENVQLI
jgi:hypothetical protein